MNKKSLLLISASLITFVLLIVAMFSFSEKLFDSGSKRHSTDFVDSTANVDGDGSENTNENDVNIEDIPNVDEQKEKIVSFLAAGDNIIHEAVMNDANKLAFEKRLEDSFYFDSMYDNLRDIIEGADIAFINQEGPIAGKTLGYSGYPAFNAPEQAGDALVNIGFDIINIANNHMLDKGETGYRNSINYWKSKPVTLIGGYESEEDFNTIRYYNYKGLKIALLSYTYGTNGYYLPGSSTMWVPYYNENNIVNKHAKEARENADIVIALMHWGDENSFKPNDIQKKYTEIFVENNVDVIIGTHPHVLQPIEWKNRPDGNKTLVAYSIGNFLSTMHYSKNMVGGLLTFNIKYIEPSDAQICDVKLIPTMCYYSKSRDSVKLYELSAFTKEMYYTHGSTLKENVSYETMLSYASDTISEEFLDEDFLELIYK